MKLRLSKYGDKGVTLVLLLLSLVLGMGCGESVVKKKKESIAVDTYVYKRVDGCRNKADVYGGVSGGMLRPVAMWIHGGALITGGRVWIERDICDLLLEKGFVVVSIDYRLAPETKIVGIMADVQDAYKWVREKGPELFGGDPDRIGVLGGSAGGYLTLMTGFCLKPRPRALVSLYGYGDIAGDWYSRPDPFYCTKHMVSTQEAYNVVGGEILSESIGTNRGVFYLYCRQHGLWPNEIVGLDPHIEPEAFKPYCPVQNVTREYSPTFLIHGDKDTDVPYEQSVQMAEELARVGVVHEFITIKGAGHGFRDGEPGDIARAYKRAVTFFEVHVNSSND